MVVQVDCAIKSNAEQAVWDMQQITRRLLAMCLCPDLCCESLSSDKRQAHTNEGIGQVAHKMLQNGTIMLCYQRPSIPPNYHLQTAAKHTQNGPNGQQGAPAL